MHKTISVTPPESPEKIARSTNCAANRNEGRGAIAVASRLPFFNNQFAKCANRAFVRQILDRHCRDFANGVLECDRHSVFGNVLAIHEDVRYRVIICDDFKF